MFVTRVLETCSDVAMYVRAGADSCVRYVLYDSVSAATDVNNGMLTTITVSLLFWMTNEPAIETRCDADIVFEDVAGTPLKDALPSIVVHVVN